MEKITSLIKQCALFFYGFIALMIAGIALLLIDGNTQSFFLLNTWHFGLLDTLLEYYTNAGDGLFAIFLGTVCFFFLKQRALGLTIFYAFLSSGIMVQLVKHIHDSPRPKKLFGDYDQRYFIQGIDFAHNNSFPSGHTTTAFAVATVCALMLSNKQWQLPLLAAALLIGFSRIYLGQHFLLDVVVGAPIGVVCGIGCVYLAKKYKTSPFFGSAKIKA